MRTVTEELAKRGLIDTFEITLDAVATFARDDQVTVIVLKGTEVRTVVLMLFFGDMPGKESIFVWLAGALNSRTDQKLAITTTPNCLKVIGLGRPVVAWCLPTSFSGGSGDRGAHQRGQGRRCRVPRLAFPEPPAAVLCQYGSPPPLANQNMLAKVHGDQIDIAKLFESYNIIASIKAVQEAEGTWKETSADLGPVVSEAQAKSAAEKQRQAASKSISKLAQDDQRLAKDNRELLDESLRLAFSNGTSIASLC
eukprot:scaffold586144_cov43-Prasinocladus_malaysianus.AAC.1